MGFVDMVIAKWHALRRGDVVAIFLLAAFLIVLAIVSVGFPVFGSRGFGPTGNAATRAKAIRSASRSQRRPGDKPINGAWHSVRCTL